MDLTDRYFKPSSSNLSRRPTTCGVGPHEVFSAPIRMGRACCATPASLISSPLNISRVARVNFLTRHRCTTERPHRARLRVSVALLTCVVSRAYQLLPVAGNCGRFTLEHQARLAWLMLHDEAAQLASRHQMTKHISSHRRQTFRHPDAL